MNNDYICQYASCHETKTPILVTDSQRGTRERYCCPEHAAAGIIHASTQDWEPRSRVDTRNTIEAFIEAFRIDRLVPRKEVA